MLFTKAYLNRFYKISAMTDNSHKITQHAEEKGKVRVTSCKLRVANQNIFLQSFLRFSDAGILLY